MIIVVVGPTGVGKTKLSVELAKYYNGIVINADSMQVYKDLNIGTAKVTEEEKDGVEHYLFDIANVKDMYTVYDYQKDGRALLEKNKDKNIIIVGGTGLYIKALLYDYEFMDEENNSSYDDLSDEELYQKVLLKYPDTDIHPHNRKRLVRALNKEYVGINKNKPLYNFIVVGLTTSRDILYDRINKRVIKMMDDGLLSEVKNFYDQGIKSKAIKTGIGYKELYDYFDNTVSLDTAIDNIQKRSRKYAKRQYTWFNNQMNVNWFDVNFDDFNKTVLEVEKFIDKKKQNN